MVRSAKRKGSRIAPYLHKKRNHCYCPPMFSIGGLQTDVSMKFGPIPPTTPQSHPQHFPPTSPFHNTILRQPRTNLRAEDLLGFTGFQQVQVGEHSWHCGEPLSTTSTRSTTAIVEFCSYIYKLYLIPSFFLFFLYHSLPCSLPLINVTPELEKMLFSSMSFSSSCSSSCTWSRLATEDPPSSESSKPLCYYRLITRWVPPI